MKIRRRLGSRDPAENLGLHRATLERFIGRNGLILSSWKSFGSVKIFLDVVSVLAGRQAFSAWRTEPYDFSGTRQQFLPGAKKRQVAVLGQAAALPSSIEFPMSLLRVSLQLAGYETVEFCWLLSLLLPLLVAIVSRVAIDEFRSGQKQAEKKLRREFLLADEWRCSSRNIDLESSDGENGRTNARSLDESNF
ncbi:hypothetical protein K0M31_012261 [Melipona bicolor]|uniref:Uncharacterized protein n=1 Tax=Melipona bicolor TaxID=60889 RepID=A0AA40KHM7_9HYME|nr:hypothetical protein K0M31_012261 [Melipona bicolor]